MRAARKILLGALALLLLAAPAAAQTAPGWTFGQVPTTAQWNAVFAGKQDYLGAPPLLTTGGTMSGKLITAASTTTNAGFGILPGVAPASPINGDVWATTAGLFVRVSGATIGPLSGGSASSFAATAPVAVAFPAGVVTYSITNGASVANPGTGTLEALLPIQTVAGASKTFATADMFRETRRSNAGSAMTDSFPASGSTGLVNGTKIVVTNVDATASDTISPGAGTTIGGGGVVGPGRAVQYVYDLAGTTWRPTLNTGTAGLLPSANTWAAVNTFSVTPVAPSLSFLAAGAPSRRDLGLWAIDDPYIEDFGGGTGVADNTPAYNLAVANPPFSYGVRFRGGGIYGFGSQPNCSTNLFRVTGMSETTQAANLIRNFNQATPTRGLICMTGGELNVANVTILNGVGFAGGAAISMIPTVSSQATLTNVRITNNNPGPFSGTANQWAYSLYMDGSAIPAATALRTVMLRNVVLFGASTRSAKIQSVIHLGWFGGSVNGAGGTNGSLELTGTASAPSSENVVSIDAVFNDVILDYLSKSTINVSDVGGSVTNTANTFAISGGGKIASAMQNNATDASWLSGGGLYFTSGGLIDWGAGDVQITHGSNTLAFIGASIGGYLFDNSVYLTANGGGSLGTSISGWRSLFLAGSSDLGVGQLLAPATGAGGKNWFLPTNAGTLASTASAPIVLNSTTGNLTCPTCATSSGGGAISGTAPIAVSGAGVVSLNDAGVTYAKLQNLGALAVMARSANSSGVGADVQATASSDAVLRESGGVLGFGTVTTAGYANASITLAKIAAISTNTLLGSTSGTTASQVAVGSCDTATKALQWTTNVGLGCNSAVNAATLGGATFAAPGAIGGGTPSTVAVTTLTAGTSVASPSHVGGTSAGSTATINGTSSGSPSSAFVSLQTNGQFVGVGNASPKTFLDLNENLSSSPALAVATSLLRLQAADGAVGGMEWVSYGASPQNVLAGVIVGNTSATPNPTPANSNMFNLKGYGYNGTSIQNGGIITIHTTNLWSGTNQGTAIDFYTTVTNTTSVAFAMRVQDSGGVSIGGVTDPGIGGLYVNANIFAPNLPTTAAALGAAVCWTATTGQFQRDTNAGGCLVSAARFKHGFEALSADRSFETVMGATPYSYLLNDNEAIGRQVGFKADDFVDADRRLVGFDDGGAVHSFRYQQYTAVLTSAFQHRVGVEDQRYRELKADNDDLRAQLKRVRGETR